MSLITSGSFLLHYFMNYLTLTSVTDFDFLRPTALEPTAPRPRGQGEEMGWWEEGRQSRGWTPTTSSQT